MGSSLSIRLLSLVLAGSLLGALPVPVSAGGSRSFRIGDFEELDKGEVEGAAIEGSGKVSVGYLAERVEVASASVFSCASARDAAYVGTADVATVHRVTLARRTSKPELKKLAELPGVVVSALLTLATGDVLAASLPGGTIHRIDKKGRVRTFAKLDVEQIWALAEHQGRVFVATGTKGELYSLGLDGKAAKVVLDVDDKDVLSLLAVGKDLVAGTSPSAKLYRVTTDPQGELLHDFSGDEVRALALVRNGLVAAVNDFTDRDLSSLDALTKNLNRTSLLGQPPAGNVAASRSAPRADAALHWVSLGRERDVSRASEAIWETWLRKEKQYFTSLLAIDEHNTVLVSSSDDAKIYRVRGRRDVATVGDLEERQATALCVLPDGSVVASSADGGAVYRMSGTRAVSARYLTEVLDAKQPALFGAVQIRGSGKLSLRARSGPSDEPDKRWGAWRAVSLIRRGDSLQGTLAVPVRRYVQLEVVLGSHDAELRDLLLFYGPENLAPLVQSVDVGRPSFDPDDDDEPEPKITIKWKADAQDEDELVYEVRVRPEGAGDKQWIKLHGQKPVSEKELKWDITSVPDGVYEVGVRASDEPSNGSGRAASDELVSAPFIVDHTRPRIETPTVKGLRITAMATDDGSYVHDVSYSVDATRFRTASPADGVFDSARERFELLLPDDLERGRHRLVLRVRDAMGNIGTMALVIER